jgi:hypothetical protein
MSPDIRVPTNDAGKFAVSTGKHSCARDNMPECTCDVITAGWKHLEMSVPRTHVLSGTCLSYKVTYAPMHFLPFFFLMLPLSLTTGLSTKIASSSLLTLLVCVLGGADNASDSISFRNSFLMEFLRFSHHCFSDSVCAWISSSLFRKTVFAAISFAD